MIIERRVRPHVALETYHVDQNPFVLGSGRLGTSRLRPAGTPIVWADWTDSVMNITLTRGGKVNDLVHRNDVGMLSVSLRGVSLNPDAPEFLPGQRIRLIHINGAKRYPLFNGEIREIEMSQLPNKPGKLPVKVLQISAVDAVRSLNETTRYGVMPETGSETFAQRITRLSQTTDVPMVLPTPAIPGLPLGRTVYESSVSNHLSIACNTVGAWWYVDGAGATRFQKRAIPAGAKVATFADRERDGTGTPFPAGTLHHLRHTAARGSRVMFTGINYANHGAQDDPDNPGSWIADDQLWQGVRFPFVIARYGLRVAQLETCYATNPGGNDTQSLLNAYTGQSMVVETVTWNAQEDIARIPDLDLGGYMYLDFLGDNAVGYWPYYIVGGVRHTITPTRWLIELSTIGATPQ